MPAVDTEFPVLLLNDVHKIYNPGPLQVHVLKGISLSVERGDYVAIMGHSGSGKSTMLNILGCLDIPTEGSYLIDGVDVELAVGRAAGRRAQPVPRLRLPELQPGPADQRPGQRRAAAGLRRGRPVGAPQAGPDRPRAGRSRRPDDAHAERALRWPAAAGGHRPGHRHRPVDHPGRRADREPRLRARPRRSSRSSAGSTPPGGRSSSSPTRTTWRPTPSGSSS